MKNTIYALIMCIALVVSACAQGNVSTEIGARNYQETAANEEKGRVVFSVTDAAADMGSISSVLITIDEVRIHSETEGWILVSSNPMTYDLLELKSQNKNELLADSNLKEGSYNQIKLEISEVTVVDSGENHKAKLPSGELKISGNFDVKSNSTSSINLDFIADKSLHVTGNGEYVMAPVVKVESRQDAAVKISSDNKVEITGGIVKTDMEVGMDLGGTLGSGVKISSDANISIAEGIIRSQGNTKTGVSIE